MSQQIPTLKLLLIGNSNVGKSSLLLRFTDDTFLPQEEVSATIGKLIGLHLENISFLIVYSRCRFQSEHDGCEWKNVQADHLGTVNNNNNR